MRGGFLYWLGVSLCLTVLPAYSLQLELPNNARETVARDNQLDRVQIPVSPFFEGALVTREIEGNVSRRAYKFNSLGVTPLQILAPLRKQIQDFGFKVVLDCNQITCGGYDFRFAIEVLPAPDMYVNIRAFHFLTGLDLAGGSAITVLVSSTEDTMYIQIIQAGLIDGAFVSMKPAVGFGELGPELLPEVLESSATRLQKYGFVILNDIDFAAGKTNLKKQPSVSLVEISKFLIARPNLRVIVVGHTDTVGSLETNIVISRERARSVRARLIEKHGVPSGKITAEGVGYLSPRASNLTERGREMNRRVEVILISEDE